MVDHSHEYVRTGPNWFAVVASGVAVLVGLGIVALRVSDGDPAWMYAIPPAAGLLIYSAIQRKERVVPTTTRGYTVFTETFTDGDVSEFVDAVQAAGYQLDVVDLRAGGAAPAADARLRNCELRLRERRADASAGDVAVRLRVQGTGAVLGYIEATDAHPGFYDEMAQYVIVALAGMLPALQYKNTATGDEGAADSLRAELPDPPYGLATL